jgi:hypothetical protein
MNQGLPIVYAIGLVFATGVGAAHAAPDWSKVPAKKLTIMLPGVASMEWILNGSDHSGARGLKKGESCTSCHEEEIADIGKKIASGEKAEPKPIKGKPGSIPVNVQAAHDGTNLYLRFQWKAAPSSGIKQDQKNQEKVAVMIDAGTVEHGSSGCWASCHDDLRTMPDVNKDAAKHPKAKDLDIRDNGPTKYLKESRSAIEGKNKPRGGWDKLKPEAEIEAALKDGKFLELWQWRETQPPRAGYVLEARRLKEAQGLAEGKCEGGTCTVTFTRKLAGGGAGSHAIRPGKSYAVGFAIHDDWANERYHHVSLGYSMAMDNPKADINIVKQ